MYFILSVAFGHMGPKAIKIFVNEYVLEQTRSKDIVKIRGVLVALLFDNKNILSSRIILIVR